MVDGVESVKEGAGETENVLEREKGWKERLWDELKLNEKNRKFYVILGLVAVVIVVLLMRGLSREEEGGEVEKTPIPEKTLVPEATYVPIPTAVEEWEEYTDEGGMLKFKYPPVELLKIDKEGDYVKVIIYGPEQEGLELFDSVFLYIRAFRKSDKTLTQIAQEKLNVLTEDQTIRVLKKPMQITIGELKGMTFKILSSSELEYYFLEKGGGVNGVEVISGTDDPGKLGFSEIEELIVSSIEIE